MSHTKEPWAIHPISQTAVVGGTGFVVAACGGHSDGTRDPSDMHDELIANARRVTACVNACKGIPTSRLEAGAADVLAYSMELKRQRDELLAALKASRETLERENAAHNGPIVDTIWHTGHETLFDFMDAAIAKGLTQ